MKLRGRPQFFGGYPPIPSPWQRDVRRVTIPPAAAAEGFRLAEQRKEFAVGIVLETIHAETDLTRAQLDYLKAVAGFNQAQYALQRAIGGL